MLKFPQRSFEVELKFVTPELMRRHNVERTQLLPPQLTALMLDRVRWDLFTYLFTVRLNVVTLFR